jgi:phosphoglucosamine mutase
MLGEIRKTWVSPCKSSRSFPSCPVALNGEDRPSAMAKLFGTDGIRGKAGEHPITAQMAERLGHAVVRVLGGKKVLIGRDTRESGEMLEQGLVDGLLGAGAQAIRLGVVPTPAVALLLREMGADAGVMLTASHNPFTDNGMKVFGEGGFKLSDELEDEIEALLLSEGGYDAKKGSVEDFPEGLAIYAERAKESIGNMDLGGLKVVIDAGNGAGFAIAPQIFRQLGAEVIEMAVSPDGRNINEECGALYAAKAGELVKQSGAHLGVSLDGDADRVIFTDASGNVLSGDRVMAMCAISLKHAGQLHDNTMVATVMSNLGMDEALRREGISVFRTGVGDRMVLEMLREKGLSFGGENSGHLIFAEHATTGDGIVSALRVCRMMKESGKTLAELAAVMDEYPSTLLNLPVREKPPLENLPKLQATIAAAEAEFGNHGRQLIRYSGTEKKIRVLVEHRDAAAVARWIEIFKNVIAEEIG